MRIVVNIVFSILISIASFAALCLIVSDYEYQTYERRIDIFDMNVSLENDNVTEIVDTRKMEDEALFRQMQYDYELVKSKNEEIVGWLNIPNIGYYPICQGIDNQYYLTHNEYKEYSKAGIPFMNTECYDLFDNIALIHGHHMKNGTMFGCLSDYKNSKFFNENDLITVFTGESFYQYKPFTVFVYEDGVEHISVELTQDDRLTYLQFLQKRSMVKTDKDYLLEEPVLCLSTCDYSVVNGRLLVGAVRVKEYDL